MVNLALAAERAARIGGTVLIEAISGPKPYPLRMAADAVAVVDRLREQAGAGNAAFLADLYHLAVNGDDLDDVIAQHADRIRHVQIADVPGRHQHGTGSLDVARHLAALERGRYTGWVGLEYSPLGPSADSFGWLSALGARQR